MRYVLVAMLVMFAAHASAQHDIQEGAGVVCDTPAQVKRFAELGAKADALNALNEGEQQPVCAWAPVRYIRGRVVDVARAGERTVQIVEILLLQVRVHGQWGQVPPEVQYTIFEIEEEGA